MAKTTSRRHLMCRLCLEARNSKPQSGLAKKMKWPPTSKMIKHWTFCGTISPLHSGISTCQRERQATSRMHCNNVLRG
ncbi:hypothetical protein Zm00014a_013392 [Zea mays]|uniref:Uncharacterized protein n=1 Tax=Zea mays TaxID=4577 RepID=A0A3L6G5J9_MAIZE|nr:hypothetical protein Zm00014a_013392 [Zea mays]